MWVGDDEATEDARDTQRAEGRCTTGARRGRSVIMTFPPEWAPMPGDDAPPGKRDGAWLAAYATPELDVDSAEHSVFSSMLRKGMPHARNFKVQRVQHRGLWKRFAHFRDHELKPYNDGDANEQWLFHGTGALAPTDVLAHPSGLDPRFSVRGGLYGAGTYLAETAAYQISGRYAHRVRGFGGERIQLLVVRAACGTPQELGTRVDVETRAMRMPGARPGGRAGQQFDSVRAGPHRPFVSGAGRSGGCGSGDASVIRVLYESRQMYPAFIITFDVPVPQAAEGIDGVEAVAASVEGSGDGGQPVARRRAHASPGIATSGAGGAASAAAVAVAATPTAAPTTKRARVPPGARLSSVGGTASAATAAAAAPTAAAAAVSAAQKAKAVRLCNEGVALVDAEAFSEARDKFRDAVDANPMHGDAWCFLASSIAEVNDGEHSEETIKAYKHAIATKTMSSATRSVAHSNLGFALCTIRTDYARAVKEFRKVVALKPGDAVAHLSMANALGHGLGRWAEARDAAVKAAELGDDRAKAVLPDFTQRAAKALAGARS